MKWKSLFFALSLALASMSATGQSDLTTGIPTILREARGVWVATVSNIDWPSKPGLSTEQQQSELLAILDRCVELNLNIVVLQVRPACDSFYASELEPWSEYLTGEQGKAPDPYYDPLEFAVAEAHKRGLEMHCWFNPYRARLISKKDKVTAENHISKTHPELVKTYGDFQWLDPGEKLVQDHSIAVMMDVVKRYDIDGVHMDDYFYPYKVVAKDENGKEIEVDGKKQMLEFPDEPSWTKYKESGGTLSRNDWRRENVDQFVKRLYQSIKKEKPYVKLGISPFGIWKPGHPEQIAGLNQFEELYADAKLWFERGWVDYYTPQLYWSIAKPQQSYPVLLKWWAEQNKKNRHLWPGLFTGKFATKETITEIPYQIEWTRIITRNPGNIHFSMKSLMNNTAGIADALTTTTGMYNKEALVPSYPWLDDEAPARPRISITNRENEDQREISWKSANEKDDWLWAVYTGTSDGKGNMKWKSDVRAAGETTMTLTSDLHSSGPAVIAVSAVDRNGNESEKAFMKVSQSTGKN